MKKQSDFNMYNHHLGARSYYYNQENFEFFFKYIAMAMSKQRTIDPAGVLGILMKNYCLSDRTLVQEIKRTPWYSRYIGAGNWELIKLPEHGYIKLEANKVAEIMKHKLIAEAQNFLQKRKKIGILLSGGMDSRVVAAVVRQLQEDSSYLGSVVGLTWGREDSRDVIYAKKISDQFNWEFRYFPLNVDILKKNIYISAERGAEYSPIHLHAMDDIARIQDLDGILAASYGDSIGRGEYSGRHLTDLNNILAKNLNMFAFMLKSVEKESLKIIREDIYKDRLKFRYRSENAFRELEMQMHYMRRQLNSCMEVIDDKIPLYQMFGAPEVFGFMWSLDPVCRNDAMYEYLLNILPGNLLKIPWARTGRRYNQQDARHDNFSSLNNCYGRYLRNELRDLISQELNCGTLQAMGIFNKESLMMWTKYWHKVKDSRANRLDEKMAWLTSLSLFIKKYDIQGLDLPNRHSLFDQLAQIKAFAHTMLYQLAIRLIKNDN